MNTVNEAGLMKTIKIGNQEWTAENLNVTDGQEGIYFNESNNSYYYTMDALKRILKRIKGFHLPSSKEFIYAIQQCGGVVNNEYYDLYTRIKQKIFYKDSSLRDALNLKTEGYNYLGHTDESDFVVLPSSTIVHITSKDNFCNLGEHYLTYSFCPNDHRRGHIVTHSLKCTDKRFAYIVRLVKDIKQS